MEGVIRTAKVKLDVPSERCDDLHQTKKNQFLHCANITSEWAETPERLLRNLQTESRERSLRPTS